MKTQHLLLVGDLYSNFAESNHMVTTISNLREMIKNTPLNQYKISIGQGVSYDEIQELLVLLENSQHKEKFEILESNVLAFQNDPSHHKNVHKHKAKNVMIAPPVNLGANCFSSSLHLQPECAELSDHTTGQHVQGMVLAEAARQMILAVGENYLLEPAYRYKAYYVLNNLNITFKKFVFPLETQVRFVVSNLSKKNQGINIRAETLSTFFQNGEEVAEVSAKFTTYESKVIFEKEVELAAQACLAFDQNTQVKINRKAS